MVMPWLALVLGVARALPGDCETADCVADEARALLDRADDDAALTMLKAGKKRFAESAEIRTLLGIAYFFDDNEYWAIRTLDAVVRDDPDNCEARTWLAWSHMHIQATDAAAVALSHPICETGDGPVTTRFLLLRSLLAWSMREDELVLTELKRARQATSAWPADKRALAGVSRAFIPETIDELTWRVDVQGGWTSDARVGSQLLPEQLSAEGGPDPSSVRLEAGAWMRWTPDVAGSIRPVVEFQPRVVQLTNSDVARYNSVDLQGRAGALLGAGMPRIFVGLRPGYLIQTRPDEGLGPQAYYQVLRGEVDAELGPDVVLFGGAGRRVFTDAGRSRTEVDGGAGWQGSVSRKLVLMGAATGRWHHSNNPQWGVVGATMTATARWRAGDWQVWPSVSVSWDRYAQWLVDDGTARSDLVLRPRAVLWTPTRHGLRAGLEYGTTVQSSTDPAYDLTDHGVMLRLRWGGTANPSLPHTDRSDPVFPFDWGLSDSLGVTDERVQDLVRQDEQAQGGCGCGQ